MNILNDHAQPTEFLVLAYTAWLRKESGRIKYNFWYDLSKVLSNVYIYLHYRLISLTHSNLKPWISINSLYFFSLYFFLFLPYRLHVEHWKCFQIELHSLYVGTFWLLRIQSKFVYMCTWMDFFLNFSCFFFTTLYTCRERETKELLAFAKERNRNVVNWVSTENQQDDMFILSYVCCISIRDNTT